jgi:predicted ATPase
MMVAVSSNALDYITIQGFKSIASIDKLELRPINVVIGSNGSGKSNFIGAFDFLREVCDGKLRDYVTTSGGAEKILHFGSKTTKGIELYLSSRHIDGWPFGAPGYKLVLSPTVDDGLFPAGETTYLDGRAPAGLAPREQGREAGISDPNAGGVAKWVRAYLLGLRLYHLNDTSSSSPMRKTARVDDNRFLKPDGSNLPAFLYLLKNRHQVEYDLIVRAVQRVAPFFNDFLLAPTELNREYIKLEWRHKKSDQNFDASSLSDGTLRFIVLATLFLQPGHYRPSVILVDEPELGLHPYAIEMLAALVRQASVHTQVIMSTQSSLLLDHFQPEDVLIADRVDGGTILTRLESEQLREWLEDYSLGQLWEKNQLGGRPVPG